jgi:predicted house-cleaning NTP pyrophosphatase (Maf/HAM1 superfamily)
MLLRYCATTDSVSPSARKVPLLTLDAPSTRVTFRPLSEAWIEWYIATGEPFDKAGAYGIQEYVGAIWRTASMSCDTKRSVRPSR